MKKEKLLLIGIVVAMLLALVAVATVLGQKPEGEGEIVYIDDLEFTDEYYVPEFEISETTLDYYVEEVVIDGQIDALWDNLNKIPIDINLLGPNHGEGMDFGPSQFRAYWNDDALFILVEVEDQTIVVDDFDNFWEDDLIEIYLDANNEKNDFLDENDWQFHYKLDGGMHSNRDMYMSDIREVDGLPTAHSMVMRNHQEHTETSMEMISVSYDWEPPAGFFSERNLKR